MIELIFFFKYLSIIFLPLYDWNMSDTAYSTIQSYPLKGEPLSEMRVSGIPCQAKWPTRWPMRAPLVAVDAQLQRNASNSLLQWSSHCSDIQISHKQFFKVFWHSVAFSLSLSLFFAISHVGPVQTLADSTYTSLDNNVRVVESF